MKKIAICILVMTLFLSGCSSSRRSEDEERAALYETYIDAIESASDFQTSSSFYGIRAEITPLSDGTGYRYDVILDNPRVAMYNVQLLVVPVDVTGALMTKDTCPSVGILDNETYNLIPHQVNAQRGFPAEIDASGQSETELITLDVLVVWNGYARLAENREFLQLRAMLVQDQQEEKTEAADSSGTEPSVEEETSSEE